MGRGGVKFSRYICDASRPVENSCLPPSLWTPRSTHLVLAIIHEADRALFRCFIRSALICFALEARREFPIKYVLAHGPLVPGAGVVQPWHVAGGWGERGGWSG